MNTTQANSEDYNYLVGARQSEEHRLFQPDLDKQCAQTLYMQAPAANATVVLIATVIYLPMMDRVEANLLLWLISIVLLTGVRTLVWYWHSNNPERFSSGEWMRYYTWSTLFVGIAWGALYLYSFNTTDQIVVLTLSLVFFGIVGAAVPILYSHIPAYVAYTYPQFFGFAVVLLSQEGIVSYFLVTALVFYLIMMTVISRNAYNQFAHNIKLQWYNDRLIGELNAEAKQRESLVRQRTAELTDANIELEEEIKQRRQAEDQATFQLTMLDSVLNATPDLIYYKDYLNQEGRYIGCNKAYAELAGITKEDICGKDDIDIFGDVPGKELRLQDREILKQDDVRFTEEWVTYPDGREILLSVLRTPFYDQFHQPIGILGISRDITELKQTEEQLRLNELSMYHLAHHDVLTDLPNRLLFRDRLTQALHKAKRRGKGLAVLFIDLDNFKNINDSFGHSVGDQVLIAVAQRLLANVRQADTAARLGGDEFTIILEDLDRPDFAAEVAQKLLAAFKQPLMIQDQELTVTMSIGIGLYPQNGEDAETLLRNADSAMYQVKGEGRNGYNLYFDANDGREMHRQGLESSLRQALENDELVLYFQPIVALESGDVCGAEVLLRWKDQQDGLLQPDRVIALAEDIALVNEIGIWIVRQACSKIVAWQEAGLAPINMAVNISGCEIEKAEFAKTLCNAIEDSGCACKQLELTISEDYLINISDAAVKNLEQLTSTDLQITIDDFGVAYSSLTYLKQFPISKLKIDRSFVRDLLVDSNDQAITRAIIALAQSLGLRTLAEGIENEKQQAFVFSQGCDQGLGPLYSKPMPEQEFLQYLKTRQKEHDA